VEPAADEDSHLGEGEDPVPDQDVAGTEFRVQGGESRHLVRAQWCGQHMLEQPGPGVEAGQYVGDREAAPLGLVGRLAEGPVQVRDVGHAYAGAVDQPGAVAVPQPDGVGQGLAGPDEPAEQRLEHREGSRDRARQ
jgi:hypothetical protein